MIQTAKDFEIIKVGDMVITKPEFDYLGDAKITEPTRVIRVIGGQEGYFELEGKKNCYKGVVLQKVEKTEEKNEIVKGKVEQTMDVSQPLFTIGIKDEETDTKERVRKHIAIEILLNMIIGKSSKLYKELYEQGILFVTPGLDYEFARGYAHVLITGQSSEPEKVYEKFKQRVAEMKNAPIESNEFNRIKKRIYGGYVKEYNDTADIARMFLADFFKEINSFDYLEEMTTINEQYVEQVLKEVFDDKKMVISVIKKA